MQQLSAKQDPGHLSPHPQQQLLHVNGEHAAAGAGGSPNIHLHKCFSMTIKEWLCTPAFHLLQ